MTEFYIEFKTWAEGKIENPWPVILFGPTNEYRHRDNLSATIAETVIQGIFLSLNEDACNKFLLDHVRGHELGVLINSNNIESAEKEIEKVFGSYERCEYCVIDDSNREVIYNQIKSAGISPSAD